MTDQPLDLVRADPGLLLRFADQIAYQTGFGRMADQILADLLARWINALPVAVTVAVCARDLAITSALLRDGAYLRHSRCPELHAATAFVAAQQQPDGGFGALAVDADPTLRDTVRLPLTLACVWALAETMEVSAASAETSDQDGLATAQPLLASLSFLGLGAQPPPPNGAP